MKVVRSLPDSPDEVQVQARKLTDYLLDPNHKDGKSKATFFEQALGITSTDWAFLQAQLVDGLTRVSYEDLRLDQYGIRFSATLPVTGRNGATATIQTAWIVRPGERASFVTAFPREKDVGLEASATMPLVVSQDITGDERWQAIFDFADRAGKVAAETCIPKPLVVEGSVFMEGAFGGAFVVVHDGRRGFARWLRVNAKGERYYSGGVSVSGRYSGLADQEKAYAEAFATVLRRNGVSCRVETYLS